MHEKFQNQVSIWGKFFFIFLDLILMIFIFSNPINRSKTLIVSTDIDYHLLCAENIFSFYAWGIPYSVYISAMFLFIVHLIF